jgi:hypothetical protein
MAESTWEWRELPILEAAVSADGAAQDIGEAISAVDLRCSKVELPRPQTRSKRAKLKALRDAVLGMSPSIAVSVLTEYAKRVTGVA